METVRFTRMEDGTTEEYAYLAGLEAAYAIGLADRVLDYFRGVDQTFEGYAVTRQEHALQTASRALRDGADEEMIVAALLHDIGDALAPCNHGEFAAAILRPYVSERTYWIVKHHGVFQAYYYAHHLGGDRNARDRFRDHPHYQGAVDFCQDWDQASFDPDYDTLPLETFEPMVRRIFACGPFRHNGA
ncbi:MAG: HD domain-containing protein [Alphaproteobacteria bacterium]|nr:HD domain-containing protein [Alphaproteobacteria bacterium]